MTTTQKPAYFKMSRKKDGGLLEIEITKEQFDLLCSNKPKGAMRNGTKNTAQTIESRGIVAEILTYVVRNIKRRSLTESYKHRFAPVFQ